jgi:glycosyltransferase involved in cell wall biosynthesis
VLGKLRTLIHRTGADVMQTWLLHADITGGLAARSAGVPWLLSERQSAGFYAGTAKFALRRWFGRRADAIVANSEAGADYWRQAGYRGPLHVVRNIVPATLQADAGAAPAARDPMIIVAVGRLSEEKNYPTLLRALERVLAQVPQARVDVLGEGHLRAMLQQQIDSTPVLAGRVRLVGHVSDVHHRLQQAAAFVSMSLFEGTPNAVLDAMRAGCPLVLSDIPTHRELVDERGARFAALDDGAGCAAALVECLLDAPASLARAEQARSGLRLQDWSPHSIAGAYLDIYRSAGRKGRSCAYS